MEALLADRAQLKDKNEQLLREKAVLEVRQASSSVAACGMHHSASEAAAAAPFIPETTAPLPAHPFHACQGVLGLFLAQQGQHAADGDLFDEGGEGQC